MPRITVCPQVWPPGHVPPHVPFGRIPHGSGGPPHEHSMPPAA